MKMPHTTSTYSQFLEDDNEISGIIEDYLKYNRPGWSQDKQHLEHGVVSTDHMPDISAEGSVDALLSKKKVLNHFK